mgnify:CR=1 FL=1|jgi:hypothetical protein
MMNNEGMSSIVVVDNHFNVLGNISTADVKVCEEPSGLGTTYSQFRSS